jgi:hypothetical protein
MWQRVRIRAARQRQSDAEGLQRIVRARTVHGAFGAGRGNYAGYSLLLPLPPLPYLHRIGLVMVVEVPGRRHSNPACAAGTGACHSVFATGR